LILGIEFKEFCMDNIYLNSDGLVHLARLALSGNRADIVAYVRKIARKVARFDPNVAEQLATLAQESNPSRNAMLRGEQLDRLPVDMDSRLELARFEDDIALDVAPIWQEPVKSKLEQVLVERTKFKELASANLVPTRSLLFTGAPGLGKSLAAKWLAKSLGLPLLTVDLAAVMSSFLGRTGNNIRNILDYAKSIDCVLFLDELDALAKRRDDATEVGELKRLVTVLLQEIDSWPSHGLMLAATNHPDLLDPAVWRRFDMIVEFPLPSETSIRTALDSWVSDDHEVSASLLDALPIVLSGMSFSDLKRTISQLKRNQIVASVPLSESLGKLIEQRIDSLSKNEKIQVARKLLESGLSQRAVNQLTGLSRDTIRRHCEAVD
jgi:SpoVK/Ycf46/Vps4 family AAA+-type ATPase